MSYLPHMPEVREAAKHSLAIRAMLAAHDAKRPGWYSPEYIAMLSALMVDFRLARGLSCARHPKWAGGREPERLNEVADYLRWPEVIDTVHMEDAIHAADTGGRFSPLVSSAVKWVTAVLLRDCWRAGIPLVPLTMTLAPSDVDAWFADGTWPNPACDEPLCYGRSVMLGHYGEVHWSELTRSWLLMQARRAAAETGAIIVGLSSSGPPTLFLADGEEHGGVICPCDGSFPARTETWVEERERMFRFYSGGPHEPPGGGVPAWIPGSGIEPACWWKCRDWVPLDAEDAGRYLPPAPAPKRRRFDPRAERPRSDDRARAPVWRRS